MGALRQLNHCDNRQLALDQMISLDLALVQRPSCAVFTVLLHHITIDRLRRIAVLTPVLAAEVNSGGGNGGCSSHLENCFSLNS